MKTFFITGLPRIRSAWLANWLTWADSFCFHDVFSLVNSLKELSVLFQSQPVPFVGASDPAILFFWKSLVEKWPKSKWVVIKRDSADSRASLEKASGNRFEPNRFDDMQTQQDNLIEAINPMVVEFEDLNLSQANRIAEYCIPGFSQPETRKIQLSRLNIQIHPPTLRSDLESNKEPSILKESNLWPI